MNVSPNELALYILIILLTLLAAYLYARGAAKVKAAEPKILIAGARDLIHEAEKAVARKQAEADQLQAEADRAKQDLEALKRTIVPPVPASLTLSAAPAKTDAAGA